jgi:phosphoribosylanthranilate isomerase
MRIKICGITNEADAVQAATLGANAIGLNFYAASPRCIKPQAAQAILRALPPFVEPVALFVNQPLAQISQMLNPLGSIRTIQWHGDEPDPGINLFPFQWIAAFPVSEQRDLLAVSRYLDLCRGSGNGAPCAVLLDARVPGQYGGTGRMAPWDLLAGFQPGVPVILAGGLNADNVAEAVRVVRPYAVDVASGVERGPGQKDAEKVRRFIDKALEAAAKVGA